jgi:hypothetical protein
MVVEVIPTQPKTIHVAVVGRRKSVAGVRLHRVEGLGATRHNGLPVTTVPRTLLDLAAMLPFDQLRRVLAEADFRGLLDVEAVVKTLGRGRTGSTALREALDIHLPELAKALSVLEEEFLPLCEAAGIPLPEINRFVEGIKVDALWRRERVIVELDGGAAHGSIARMRIDRARDLDLREAGWRVLRYSADQVRKDSRRLAVELKRELCL